MIMCLPPAHLNPASFGRRLQYCVRDIVGQQAVPERGCGGLSRAQRRQEIGGLVDERVLISDLQTRHPPMRHIRMVAVRDVEASPAPHTTLTPRLEIPHP